MSSSLQPRDPPGERRMPIGWDKGVKLKEIPTKDLQKTREWCREREDEGKDWKSLIEAIDSVLEDRLGPPLGLEDTDMATGRRGRRR